MRLIVLADLDEDHLAALAAAVPGLDLVVGGAVAQPSQSVRAIGTCRVVHVANEGKTIGWWPWGDAACAFDLIGAGLPDDPGVRTAIQAYQERLGALDLRSDQTDEEMTALDPGDHGAARYVGTASCITCHPRALDSWVHSRHAQALAALQARHYDVDPDCLRCHVTGLSLPDGYHRHGSATASALVAAVTCESCHGRASVHAAEQAAGRAASGTLEPVTPATCLRCHDAENSPSFAYTAYWEKISHDAR